jgi:hypothetical protein
MLDRNSEIASRFYPEAFAPENSLNASDDGDLNIALAQIDFTRRLAIFFDHVMFKVVVGMHRPAVMTIVSELVDNLFAAGKGNAQRVRVTLSGRLLTVSDDGVAFDSFTAAIPNGAASGIGAMRAAIAESKGQVVGYYVPKEAGDSIYNTTTLTISPTTSSQPALCGATGPAEYLLNRDDASRFVRGLAISDECTSFTLRLFSATTYANHSATSQLLSDLRQRLNGRPLLVKIGQDCVRFLPALQYAAMPYSDVSIEYI